MPAWADRLAAAVRAWEEDGPQVAAALLREAAAARDPDASPEAARLLGRALDGLDGHAGAAGGPASGQRSRFTLGALLMSLHEPAAAHRHLASAAAGADPALAAAAEAALARVLARLGDGAAARAAAGRAQDRARDTTAAAAVADLLTDLDRDGATMAPPPDADPTSESDVDSNGGPSGGSGAGFDAEPGGGFASASNIGLKGGSRCRPEAGAGGGSDPGPRGGAGGGSDGGAGAGLGGGLGGGGFRAAGAVADYLRAERLLAEGSPAAAEAVLRRVLGSGRPWLVSEAAFRLYSLYTARSELKAARDVAERALVEGDPARAGQARHLLGAALARVGDHAAALRAHRLAAADPDPSVRLPSLLAVARLTAAAGDRESAPAILREVAASGREPFALEARACLAQAHMEAGRVADALDECRAVLAAGESEHAPAVMLFLTRLLPRAEGARRDALLATAAAAMAHPDADVASGARLLLVRAAAEPDADPVGERALRDTDRGLDLLRAGDVRGARESLRRAAGSGAAGHGPRAVFALALLELGEGDADLAAGLLARAAGSADEERSLVATLYLHLLRGRCGARHPVLRATMDHQRHGRERGLASWRAAARDADPGIAALAAAMLARLLTDLAPAEPPLSPAGASGRPAGLHHASTAALNEAAGPLNRAPGTHKSPAAGTSGLPAGRHVTAALNGLSVGSHGSAGADGRFAGRHDVGAGTCGSPGGLYGSSAWLFRVAVASGDALTLSFAALAAEPAGPVEGVGLLRRAHAAGHPVLAPWVAARLGSALAAGLDGAQPREALRAFEEALTSGCAGVRERAENGIAEITARLDELDAAQGAGGGTGRQGGGRGEY